MNNFKLIHLNSDWHKKGEPELTTGAVYLVQDIRYDIDKQGYSIVFEKIGEPVDKSPRMVEIRYA